MKTKCFILILLSCLFFSLYSCGKSGENINSDSNDSNSNEPLTYELGEYDIQKYETNDVWYINIQNSIKNLCKFPIDANIEVSYEVENEIFSKTFDISPTTFYKYPQTLLSNKCYDLKCLISSDRSDITIIKIDEKIERSKLILLDIVSTEKSSTHYTGPNKSDCYDINTLSITFSTQNFIDACKYKYTTSQIRTMRFYSLIYCFCLTTTQKDYIEKHRSYNTNYVVPFQEFHEISYGAGVSHNSEFDVEQNSNMNIEIKGTKKDNLNKICELYVYVTL